MTGLLGLVFVRATWPGWMNGDAGTQWMVEASGNTLISDYHSPRLSWAWSLLEPTTVGPRGPLLMQTTAYFLGAAMVLRWVGDDPRAWQG